jgi:hypothetical protein
MYRNDFERIETIVRALLAGLIADVVYQIRCDVATIGHGPEAAECDAYLAENVVHCHGGDKRQVYVMMMAALGGPCCRSAVKNIMRNDPYAAVRLAAVYAACDTEPYWYRGILLWVAQMDVHREVRDAAEMALVAILDEPSVYSG